MTFMSRFARTGNGWWWHRTDAAGGQPGWSLDGAVTARATGDEPTPAGTGPVTSRGVGPLTIMAAGIGAWDLAGFGCRTRNGRRPGFRGAKEPDTSAGHPCPLPPGSERAALSRFTKGRSRPTRLSS